MKRKLKVADVELLVGGGSEGAVVGRWVVVKRVGWRWCDQRENGGGIGSTFFLNSLLVLSAFVFFLILFSLNFFLLFFFSVLFCFYFFSLLFSIFSFTILFQKNWSIFLKIK